MGFVIHQDMKDAMTRQQQAYAAPAVSQPTGNPVYNATHDSEGNVLESALQESNIVNAPVPTPSPTPTEPPSDYWVNPATKSFETATAQASSTPAPAPVEKVVVVQPSTFWEGPATSTAEMTAIIHPSEAAVLIPKEEGYVTTNLRPVVVDGKEMIAYDLVPEVKQSDLSIASQLTIGIDALSKVFPALVEQQYGKDTPLSKIIKTEYATSGQFLLGFGAGEIAALESNVYGTAGLFGSAKKSLESGKLVYAPGFEGFNSEWKTPILAPSSVSAAIGSVFGDSGEAEAFRRQSLGYQLGSVAGEVGVIVVSGEAAGRATGFVRANVTPKFVNVAESVMARSKLAVMAGLDRIEPGMGKAAELTFDRDVAKISKALGGASSKVKGGFNNKLIQPAKSKLVNPVLKRGELVQDSIYRAVDAAITPKGSDEASVFMRAVAKPNLNDYSKVANLNINLNKAKGYKPKFEFETPSSISNAKGFARQVLKAEKVQPKTVKPYVNNPIKNLEAELKQPLKAQPVKPDSDMFKGGGKGKGQIVQIGLDAKSQTVVKSEAFKVSKMTKAYNNQLKANRSALQSKQGVNAQAVSVQVSKEAPALVKPSKLRISGAPNIVRPYPDTSRQRESESVEYTIVTYPKGVSSPRLPNTRTGQSGYNIAAFMPVVGSGQGRGQQFIPKNTEVPFTSEIGKSIVDTTPNKPVQSQPITPKYILDIPEPTKTIFDIPTIVKPKSKPASRKLYDFPMGNVSGFGAGGGGGSSVGRWYYRKHPIPDATQQIKQLTGGRVRGPNYSKGKHRRSKSKSKRRGKR